MPSLLFAERLRLRRERLPQRQTLLVRGGHPPEHPLELRQPEPVGHRPQGLVERAALAQCQLAHEQPQLARDQPFAVAGDLLDRLLKGHPRRRRQREHVQDRRQLHQHQPAPPGRASPQIPVRQQIADREADQPHPHLPRAERVDADNVEQRKDGREDHAASDLLAEELHQLDAGSHAAQLPLERLPTRQPERHQHGA